MKLWQDRRGNEFVEAALVIPIITLVVVILLNAFVFYMNILVTGVRGHKEAYELWDSGSSSVIKTYRTNKDVYMLRSGLLHSSPSASLEIKAYYFNEDLIVRAEGLLDEK